MQPAMKIDSSIADDGIIFSSAPECGTIYSTREDKLAEAFEILFSLDERQLITFISLLEKEML